MPISRHANTELDSKIIAIITYIGNDVGLLGPRFGIQAPDFSERLMKLDQLADFLNDTTGKNALPRTISKEVEEKILKDFSEILIIRDGKYAYTGPHIIDKHDAYETASYSQYCKGENLLLKANSKKQSINAGTFTKKEALAVGQHEIAITNAASIKPILGSYGAGPCIIIAAFNPSTKQALLAHVDAVTVLSSLTAHLSKISESGTILQVHLAGGDHSTKTQAAELITLIAKLGSMEIVSADIGNGMASKSLAIDSHTGEIFTSFTPEQLEADKDSVLRMQIVQTQTHKSPIGLIFEDITGGLVPTMKY